MFEPFADVPAYPLVFPVFWGAAAFFVLAMARHLRVFAAVRASGPSPFSDIPARFAGLDPVRVPPDRRCSGTRGPALMHAGIFWGFVAAHHRDRQHRDRRPHPGGRLRSRSTASCGRWSARCRTSSRSIVLVVDRLGVRAAPRRRSPARLTLQPRRAGHPRDDRRRRRDRAAAPRRSRSAALRRHPGRLRLERARGPAAGAARRRGARGRCSPLLWWGHIALVAAFLCYLPFSKHLHIAHELPEHLVPQARAARRAADDGPRGRGRHVRPQDPPGPRLEGPARRLHLHRVRPLPGGLPGLEHRASRSTPRHFIMGIRDMSVEARARHRHHPELADRPRDVRPRRHDRPPGRAAARRSSTPPSRTTRSGTA